MTKPRGAEIPRSRTASKSITPLVNSGSQNLPSTNLNTDEHTWLAMRAGNESDVRKSQFQDPEVNLRRQVDEILQVLEPLHSMDEIQDLVEHYITNAAVALVPAPIMRYATSRLAETARELSLQFGTHDIDALRDFATTVLSRTSSPLSLYPNMEYRSFVDMFTGDSLRVEMMGLIYTMAARSRIYKLSRHRPTDDRKMYFLFKAAKACLDLARELVPTVNDVMMWLAFEMTRLYTNAQGDVHPNVWRAMGDTISDAYIMDLHREVKVSAGVPFWLAECRRKNWATIYHWDKSVATYFQRPPRISKRYSECQLPLDLTDAELFATPEILHAARSNLTPEGWNPDGAYCSTTWYRMRFLASEILEDQWDYKDRKLTASHVPHLELLAERCQTLRSSFPDSLKYSPEMWESTSMTPSQCCMMAIIHLMHLNLELQVHIMLMRLDGGYTASTLKLAAEIASTVNNFGSIRANDKFLNHDNAYVLLGYGLPAVSVLIPALSETSTLPPSLSRSKLIRDLSVFIGYLETICVKGDPNYGVCIRAAQVFSRALDEILEPKSGGGGGGGGGGMVVTTTTTTTMPVVVGDGGGGDDEMGEGEEDASILVGDDGWSGMMMEGFSDLEGWMQSVDWSSIGGEYTL